MQETVSRSNVRAMTTFVLVHGAWGGSYGFKYVRGPLREAGHEVFTPSLTGIGERAHLASPQVDLTTHVTDVVIAVPVGPELIAGSKSISHSAGSSR